MCVCVGWSRQGIEIKKGIMEINRRYRREAGQEHHGNAILTLKTTCQHLHEVKLTEYPQSVKRRDQGV